MITAISGSAGRPEGPRGVVAVEAEAADGAYSATLAAR
jgi:hypothetical protein